MYREAYDSMRQVGLNRKIWEEDGLGRDADRINGAGKDDRLATDTKWK
jgi:hypothetical protein